MSSRKEKTRLDELLVSRGLVDSRNQARSIIMAGDVLVEDRPVTKAGTAIKRDALIRIRPRKRFVSRGGDKLAGALDDLELCVSGLNVLDIGASTGGFVDCLLNEGAAAVCACDVGYGQLAWKLRCDSRVHVLDRVNARNLELSILPWVPDLVTCDVSFISLTLLLKPIRSVLPDSGQALLMVKPQFEVGKGKVGKGGVVRDRHLREQAVETVILNGIEHGFMPLGIISSQVTGPAGNHECFVLLGVSTGSSEPGEKERRENWRPWLAKVL
ncbi:MAG: TlyA family RNA methyltransferase [bacterium]|nr:TlyA family RNA methyltransferase [bacterium]